ncbi:MAG: NAD(P)H-hydrate dehydratase [Endomicrobiales bacterium]
MKITTRKITPSQVRLLIKPREKYSHKGAYGHVLIVAGSEGMTGAAALAARGALRAGAGLVTVGTPRSQSLVLASRLSAEAMTLSLPEEAAGTLGMDAFEHIMEFVEGRGVSSIVMGPGLKSTEGVYRLVREIASRVALPLVLDADAINVFSYEHRDGLCFRSLAKAKARIIVTPHPGELSRVTGISVSGIQGSRAGTAARFARENNAVCVLKGAGTVVSDGKQAVVNPTGNPGMATGGSGDVLSGVIGALVMQVREPETFNAALCGVYLHGLAGDIAAGEKTRISLLAGDIAEGLPAAFAKLLGKP